MRFTSLTRSILMAGSAIALVSACTDASVEDVATPGAANPIVINPIVGGGGGSGGASFATRSTAPTTAADCGANLVFISGVATPGGATTNYCSLTAAGGGTVTGTLNVPFRADPILISGTVFLGNGTDGSANVTFAEGQQFVTQGATGVVDLLVVSRGSRMNAVGSPTSPIVFTSVEDFEDDGQPNGSSGTGDWGGIAINGKAPLNECTVNPAATAGTDACRQNGEGGSGEFGGGDAADNSGSFQYIRVQHAGFPFTPSNELNGIALQGVGSGTTFRFVQVHKGADDGFEWFGGTVNGDHLVVTGANDDSLDWTDGWSGAVQFALVVQANGDDNGIEGDNNGDTSADASPRSMPRLSNLTLIGDGASGEGIQVRAGTAGRIVNATVANFAEGLEFNPAGTGANPVINSLVLAGNVVNFSGSGASLFGVDPNNVAAVTSTLNGVFPGANETNATAVNPTTVDPTFTAASFVGAFGPSDTPSANWTSGWTVAGSIPGAAAPSCPTGTTTATETPASANFTGRSETLVCIVNNPVVGDVRLTSGNLYRLDGTVFIGADRGGDPASPTPGTIQSRLTVDPGVTIFGNQATGIVDLLVVSRGNQIFVNGSEVAPVILTSRADLVNGGSIRSGATGEIGGIAINGRAPLNECTINPAATAGTAACSQNGEGGSGPFGGGTAADNSGRINYMQVRYAGFPFTPTNELNSLALQGVGSGTQIDYVQVVNGADDGLEWFGGTVDVKHVVVLGANDDSIDWTDGWSGSLQYAIVRQNTGDDNGIEGDNNGDTSADASPRSTPAIANITLIGDGASGEGIQVRAGTAGTIVNAAVANFAEGIEFNPAGTGPNPVLNGIGLVGNVADFSGAGATLDSGANIVQGIAGVPLTGSVAAQVQAVNAAAIAGGATAVDPIGVRSTLTTGTYIGAISGPSDTWYAGWTIGL